MNLDERNDNTQYVLHILSFNAKLRINADGDRANLWLDIFFEVSRQIEIILVLTDTLEMKKYVGNYVKIMAVFLSVNTSYVWTNAYNGQPELLAENNNQFDACHRMEIF